MQFLSVPLIVDLHKTLILQFGGLGGLRDKGLLESAVAHPTLLYSIAMERDKYVIASAYCYHLIHNHPFIDGNKRIGVLAMLTFLKINDAPLHIPPNDLYELSMNIATSKINEKKIATILKKYSSSSNA